MCASWFAFDALPQPRDVLILRQLIGEANQGADLHAELVREILPAGSVDEAREYVSDPPQAERAVDLAIHYLVRKIARDKQGRGIHIDGRQLELINGGDEQLPGLSRGAIDPAGKKPEGGCVEAFDESFGSDRGQILDRKKLDAREGLSGSDVHARTLRRRRPTARSWSRQVSVSSSTGPTRRGGAPA